MLQSMTGFGSKEDRLKSLGKVNIELRGSNHKFLDISLHLPEGFLALEERVKKEIETKVKRGRVTCVINLSQTEAPRVFINHRLLKNYLAALRSIKAQAGARDEIHLETLAHLPGVLSLTENRISKEELWPALKTLLSKAVENLARARQKEGQALAGYLRKETQSLRANLEIVRRRFKKAIKDKLGTFKTDEERSAFLRSAEISEEIQRLAFHARSFQSKLGNRGPVGKELDFIAQEMQREANTMAAKSFDAQISSCVVQLKSQVEKIREQVQNAE